MLGASVFLLCSLPGLCDFRRARSKTAELQLANLQVALTEFHKSHGFYPDSAAGLAALVPDGYIGRVPTDPWNEPYEYSMYGSHYVVRSFGADHRFGGSGDDDDVDRFVVTEEGE